MTETDLTLILFDDEAAQRWEPFALTRPAGELLFGVVTARARAERIFGVRCVGHIGAAHLAGFDEPDAAPMVEAADIPQDRPRLYLLSRFIPDWSAEKRTRFEAGGPVLAEGGETVGWYAPAGEPGPPDAFFSAPVAERARPSGTLPGRLIERVWNLVSWNPEQVGRDIDALFPRSAAPPLPPGVHHWGEHPLVLDRSATVEPGSAFDTSAGPIWLDRNSHVRAFTRLAGPAYLGEGSTVLGGPVEAASIGPVCRVRGELAETVCLGYTNKQHDGHIGHAYLGRWVNLGAETTNSDLKNNYGTIRMWTPEGPADSGEIKMGSLIGDHVKTGIGLLLNTGTVIGAGSNLYGAAMPPTFVPPFSWGTGDALVEYRLDKFLEVTERAMGRRKVPLSGPLREQLGRAWARGRGIAGT